VRSTPLASSQVFVVDRNLLKRRMPVFVTKSFPPFPEAFLGPLTNEDTRSSALVPELEHHASVPEDRDDL
jgi:hypothetical protein